MTPHPLIENMGKEIRSRFWFRGDMVDFGSAEMPNLRILIIRKCHFSAAPNYLPNSLKVLEWWNYPSEELASDFNSKKLVICKLPNMGLMSSPKLIVFLQASICFSFWSFLFKIIHWLFIIFFQFICFKDLRFST